MRDGLRGDARDTLVVELVPAAAVARHARVMAAARRARVAYHRAQLVAVDFRRAICGVRGVLV